MGTEQSLFAQTFVCASSCLSLWIISYRNWSGVNFWLIMTRLSPFGENRLLPVKDISLQYLYSRREVMLQRMYYWQDIYSENIF